MDTKSYDIAIIGGGAAGLSAALVLGRARRRVVVIDAGKPRNAPPRTCRGSSRATACPLPSCSRPRATRSGATAIEIVDDRVVDAAAGFTLGLAGGGTVAARQVLLATGARDELPDVRGVRERWGRDFLHCPYCHGWEVRDQPLGVLSTGAGSADYAHLLRQWSDDVILFTHGHAVTAAERASLDARGIAVVDGTVARLVVEDDALRAVELADGRTVPRAAVSCARLRAHPDGPAVALGCELTADGLVRADASGRTSVPGVWAAGNASNPRAQVITAAGEGSAAAIAINTELIADDVDRAARATAAA
jgi:thioredoxin reductase